MMTRKTKVFAAIMVLLQGAVLSAAGPYAADQPENLGGARFNDISLASLPGLPAADIAAAPEYTDAARYLSGSAAGMLVVEPDNARGPVLALINGARRSLDVTIYTISDSQVVNALTAAQKRGVAVRVIYNYNSFAAKNIFPNDKAVQAITDAGGQARKAGTAYAITHQKTITADGATSLIMTFNLSASYFANSRDFGYLTSDPAQVREVERVFEADWNGAAVTPAEDSLVWSPVNSRSKILEIINGARRTLLVDNEETGDKQCMSALMDAAKRGVAVRFLTAVLAGYNAGPATDGGSSYTGAGGADANAAERAALNAAGVQAKGATNHYMHAKMLLADYGTSAERGFIGSENFSVTSLNKNRELGVVLTDAATLTKLDGVFESDWSANK